MNPVFVNIHTHRPTGSGIELRTAGIHPWDAPQADSAALDRLARELESGGVQAVGETGLDFARPADRDAQVRLFRAQLALACRYGLPVVLHCVKAFEQTMRLLREQEPRAVIFHGFIGSPEQARQALERGYYLSFGERTFASPRTVEALKETPLSQLFLETDDSETPVKTIYTRVAELLALLVEELKRATTENYERIFIHG
ncbi:TatD family hydrolase [uncultured Alistipes sp.]|uniref:TatD family hydrolase n=1 Tax=uncultured Alistipes sp. TaxID=538949 RepID=UPI00266F879D|nr:TatD family hydrolase [uncultured Alistipes sp.]